MRDSRPVLCRRQTAVALITGLLGMVPRLGAQIVSDTSAARVAGTYQLDLATVPGPYTSKQIERRTMLLVLGTDTVAFSAVRGDRTYSRGFPSNACWAVARAGEPFRWATVGRWTPGRGDTTRILVERGVDDQTRVILTVHGDSVAGREVHWGYPELNGEEVARGGGRRIGGPDPDRCVQIQNGH